MAAWARPLSVSGGPLWDTQLCYTDGRHKGLFLSRRFLTIRGHVAMGELV